MLTPKPTPHPRTKAIAIRHPVEGLAPPTFGTLGRGQALEPGPLTEMTSYSTSSKINPASSPTSGARWRSDTSSGSSLI
jgi:hypothetical protein